MLRFQTWSAAKGEARGERGDGCGMFWKPRHKARSREKGQGRERQTKTRGARRRTKSMAKLSRGGKHVAMGLLFGTAFGMALSAVWTASKTGMKKASNAAADVCSRLGP